MIIRNKTTGKIYEVAEGTKYAKTAYEVVGKEQRAPEPTKAELLDELKALDPDTKLSKRNTAQEIKAAIAEAKAADVGGGEADAGGKDSQR